MKIFINIINYIYNSANSISFNTWKAILSKWFFIYIYLNVLNSDERIWFDVLYIYSYTKQVNEFQDAQINIEYLYR